MRRAFALASVMLTLRIASAAADEIEHVGYHVEGLTADGKYAVFRKEASGGEQPCRDISLVVWQVTPAKQVASASIFRAGPSCSAPLGKAAGLRERGRLAAKYGDFVPRTRLDPKPGGLSGGGLTLLLDVVGIFPALDPGNPAANAKRRVPVRLQLTAERGGISRVLIKKDIKVAPVLAPGSDKHFVWRKPELAEGQVSTDGKLVAVILDERPAVFVLPALASPR
jgi:hypothetical protein